MSGDLIYFESAQHDLPSARLALGDLVGFANLWGVQAGDGHYAISPSPGFSALKCSRRGSGANHEFRFARQSPAALWCRGSSRRKLDSRRRCCFWRRKGHEDSAGGTSMPCSRGKREFLRSRDEGGGGGRRSCGPFPPFGHNPDCILPNRT